MNSRRGPVSSGHFRYDRVRSPVGLLASVPCLPELGKDITFSQIEDNERWVRSQGKKSDRVRAEETPRSLLGFETLLLCLFGLSRRSSLTLFHKRKLKKAELSRRNNKSPVISNLSCSASVNFSGLAWVVDYRARYTVPMWKSCTASCSVDSIPSKRSST